MRLTPEAIQKIILEIYQELYANSEPKADFYEMMKTGEARTPHFFNKYFLEQSKQDEITEKILDKYKISGILREQIIFNTVLGSSPKGFK